MNKISPFIKTTYIIITILINIHFLYKLMSLNILPIKYILLIILILLFINCLSIIFIITKKRLLNIIAFIIYIILIIVTTICLKYINKTNTILETSFSNNNLEINTYNIITLKNKYNYINELNNSKLGYYLNDNINKVINKINQNIDVSLYKYDDINEIYNDLISNKVDAILIEESYLDILNEEYPSINELISVIYFFDLTKKIEKNNNKIEHLNPFNIYISGSDSRSANLYNKSRSDVNIVLTINPNTRDILMTSFPRDYYVSIHNHKGLKDKLTHCGIYGLETSKQTIEDLLNIKIDYSIKINFNGVIKIVDIVDGVDIYSDQTFYTWVIPEWQVQKGMNHMNGEQALAYARERHAYASGDRHRISNQQQVLEAVLKKAMTNKRLLIKHDDLLTSLNNLYYTDIPKELITLLVKEQLNNLKEWKIETNKLDGVGSKQKTYSSPKYLHYVMIPNEEDIRASHDKIVNLLNK